MRPIATLSLVLSLAALDLRPETALAQCPDAVDAVLIYPQHLANGVPRNVVLRAEFPPTRDPGGTPQWMLWDPDGDRIEGETGWDGSTSTFTPNSTLERGYHNARVTAQATGEFWEIAFNVGADTDEAAPSFGGLTGVSWIQRDQDWLIDNCSLARGDGFVFDLDLDQASDETSSGEDLCLYLYQTEGPGAEGDAPVARVAAGDRSVVRLFRSFEEGEGEFCFRAQVRDLAGRFDGNGEEVCVEAISGAVFGDVCSTASPGAGHASAAPVAALLGVVLWLAVRRRRSAP